jgi:hypothetical protein
MKKLTFNDVSEANEAAEVIRQLGSNRTMEVRGSSIFFTDAQPSPVLLVLLKSRYGFEFSESDVDTFESSLPQQKTAANPIIVEKPPVKPSSTAPPFVNTIEPSLPQQKTAATPIIVKKPPTETSSTARPVSSNDRVFSIASLVIGIVNLCAWSLPICGIPLGIVGLVVGYFGMKDISQKNVAIAGMVLSGIGLLLACGSEVLLVVGGLLSNSQP